MISLPAQGVVNWYPWAQSIHAAVDRGAFDVLEFGAVGNGVTDDTATIQAAINGAAGRTVRISKTHVVSSLTIPSYTVVEGMGQGKLIHKAGSTGAAILMTGSHSVVRDLTIDGNVTNQTNANLIAVNVRGIGNRFEGNRVLNVKWDGIVISTSTESKVNKNFVYNTGRFGITVNWDGTTPTQNAIISNNYVEATNDGGCGIVGVGYYITFDSNIMRSTGGDGIAAYSDLNRHVTAIGNNVGGTTNHGIHLGGNDLTITGNTIHNINGGHGIMARNNDAVAGDATTNPVGYNVTISGNNIEDIKVGNGIEVDTYNTIAISGNAISGPNSHGILVENSADFAITGNVIFNPTVGSGVYLGGSQRGTVTGNTIRNSPADAIKIVDRLPATSQLVTVVGNTVVTATGWGLLTSGSTNRILQGSNIFRLCTAGAVSMVGANNVSSGTNLTA